MSKKIEINIDAWNDAISGKSNNPVGSDEIKRMAEECELVVADDEGNLFVPVLSDDGKWSLIPETQ